MIGSYSHYASIVPDGVFSEMLLLSLWFIVVNCLKDCGRYYFQGTHPGSYMTTWSYMTRDGWFGYFGERTMKDGTYTGEEQWNVVAGSSSG